MTLAPEFRFAVQKKGSKKKVVIEPLRDLRMTPGRKKTQSLTLRGTPVGERDWKGNAPTGSHGKGVRDRTTGEGAKEIDPNNQGSQTTGVKPVEHGPYGTPSARRRSIAGVYASGMSSTQRGSRADLNRTLARGGSYRSRPKLFVRTKADKVWTRAHLMASHAVPEGRVHGTDLRRNAGPRQGQRQSPMSEPSLVGLHERLHRSAPDLWDHHHDEAFAPKTTSEIRDALSERLRRASNNWAKWDAEHRGLKKMALSEEFRFAKGEPTSGDLHSQKPLSNVSIAFGIGGRNYGKPKTRLTIMKGFRHTELLKGGVCSGDGPCDTSPLGDGDNWVTRTGGLPPYVRAIAHALMRKGMDKQHAIATAVSTSKKFAAGKAGKGKAKPGTVARGGAAVASWEAKRAAAHAMSGHHDGDRKVSKGERIPLKGLRLKAHLAEWHGGYHHESDESNENLKYNHSLLHSNSHLNHQLLGGGVPKFHTHDSDNNWADWDAEHGGVKKTGEVTIRGEISKLVEPDRNFFGWGYVTHDEDGNLNVDKSGEFMSEISELEKGAYDFVLESRIGDVHHDMGTQSTLIESMVFTPEKMEALGIPEGMLPSGWWVGFHTEDDELFSEVKKGGWMFSIHGDALKRTVTA